MMIYNVRGPREQTHTDDCWLDIDSTLLPWNDAQPTSILVSMLSMSTMIRKTTHHCRIVDSKTNKQKNPITIKCVLQVASIWGEI